ncbi:phosphoribosyl-ATP diphosphatase [Conchiformibius kuhniae]|uniref:Phosphoribosyl-ATP pyrophosphatase n=1 Tax=Conchiformibius kuhniae TaxID=211502 RepID=A0A8T9MSQ7_9NEIS|nr:phosphoribosyl-ATP diphosphatase [Conchiformibius kuhniae]UOP04114.1 phosphoribosyl-ATP diphosphatase [Conchiformibius kuhniae]
MNDILPALADMLEQRRSADAATSYTAKLLQGDTEKILKKIIEEAGEVLMAAKDGDREHLVYETADLWFHSMILLAQQGIRVENVLAELARRQGVSGLAEKAARQPS